MQVPKGRNLYFDGKFLSFYEPLHVLLKSYWSTTACTHKLGSDLTHFYPLQDGVIDIDSKWL